MIEGEILGGAEGVPDEAEAAWLAYLGRTVLAEGWRRSGLPVRERSMIAVAALATLGCDRQLQAHIRAAAAAGLDRATLCAVMMQVGGYAGVGRGLDGLCAVGQALADLPTDGPSQPLEVWSDDEDEDVRLARGLEVLQLLRPGRDPLGIQYPFAPDWRRWLVRTAFGDLWARRDLTLVERERVTLAVLVALGRERELREHVAIARELGIPATEIGEELTFLAVYVGFPAVVGALRTAAEVLDEKEG